MQGASVGIRGNKRLLPFEAVAEVEEEITGKAMRSVYECMLMQSKCITCITCLTVLIFSTRINAVSKDDLKGIFQKKMKSERHLNSIAADTLVPISGRTVNRYCEQIAASTRDGKIKPQSREEPFANIRNSISKAAGVTVLSKLVAMENIHSEDEVGVFLFPRQSKRPIQLVSTKAADEFLRKNNISLSTCEEANQQRAAHIGACL